MIMTLPRSRSTRRTVVAPVCAPWLCALSLLWLAVAAAQAAPAAAPAGPGVAAPGAPPARRGEAVRVDGYSTRIVSPDDLAGGALPLAISFTGGAKALYEITLTVRATGPLKDLFTVELTTASPAPAGTRTASIPLWSRDAGAALEARTSPGRPLVLRFSLDADTLQRATVSLRAGTTQADSVNSFETDCDLELARFLPPGSPPAPVPGGGGVSFLDLLPSKPPPDLGEVEGAIRGAVAAGAAALTGGHLASYAEAARLAPDYQETDARHGARLDRDDVLARERDLLKGNRYTKVESGVTTISLTAPDTAEVTLWRHTEYVTRDTPGRMYLGVPGGPPRAVPVHRRTNRAQALEQTWRRGDGGWLVARCRILQDVSVVL